MDYRQYKLNRNSLLEKALVDCLRELYARAQPSLNYDFIIKRNKELLATGTKKDDLPKDYETCYLSAEEAKYVINKYAIAYKAVHDIEYDTDNKSCNIIYDFDSSVDVLIRDMTKGCSKDKYIEEHTDENGNYHPGYRGYEKVPPLKEEIGEENAKKVIDFLNGRKDFYRFDKREYNEFSFLHMYAPHSNHKFIQDQYSDLVIDPRHLTMDEFWCEEEYGVANPDEEDPEQ